MSISRCKITSARRGILDVRKLGPKAWEIRGSGCIYDIDWYRGKLGLLVPAGYRDDGASIPKAFRDEVDPEMAFDWAHPHDMVYEAHGGDRQFKVWNDDGSFRLGWLTDCFTDKRISISKEEIDAILYCGWRESGMGRIEAMKGYLAVKHFGGHAWDSEELTGASVGVKAAA